VLSILLSLSLSAAPLQDLQPELLAPDSRRVLFSAEGVQHRGRSRLSSSGWEIYTERSWRPLSAKISRHVLERDLIRESKSLGQALPKTESGEPHPGPQQSYARWQLSNGLFTEGLLTLDELFKNHPSHEPALTLLRSLPLPPELPTLLGRDVDEIKRALRLALSFSKGKGAAHRELAIRRLGELSAPERTLTPFLQAGRAHERALAAHGLRRLAPAQSLEPLLLRCALDSSEEVRRESALALAATGEEGVTLPLIRALSSRYSSVRANSAEALGVAGFPAALPALNAQLAKASSKVKASSSSAPPRSHIFIGKQTAYVQDFDVEVAQGAAVADPAVNVLTQGSVLDVRVLAVTSKGTTTKRELRALRAAIAQLERIAKERAHEPGAAQGQEPGTTSTQD
jgi:hypothetical protein